MSGFFKGDPNVVITVEAGFSAGVAGAGVWDLSTWDNATWGQDLTWVDVSDYVRAITTKLGKSREYDHFVAATGTLVLANTDARFSPQNLAGPYVVGGLTGVRPRRPVRITVTAYGVPGSLFYGTIDTLEESFPGTKDAIVTLDLVDGIARLAAFNGFEQTPAGADETVGIRMHRILDNAKWDLPRNIDLGVTTMQATTLAQNAWGELLLTADSDGGEAWVDPDGGTFTYQAQGSPFSKVRSNTVQAIFSDTGVAGTLKYTDPVFAYSGDTMVNVSMLARAGGTQRTATNEASRALYDDIAFSRSDLVCTDDGQVLSLASQMVATRGDPELRIAGYTVMPQDDPTGALWQEVMARKIRDRTEVIAHHPSASSVIDREVFVTGIEHNIVPGLWKTTYRTESASAFPNSGSFGVWDSSGSMWDDPSTVWAY